MSSYTKAPEELTIYFITNGIMASSTSCSVQWVWNEGRGGRASGTRAIQLHHPLVFQLLLPRFLDEKKQKVLSLSGIPVFIKHIPAYDPTWSSRQLTSCTGRLSFSPFHRFVWTLRSEAAAVAQRLRALATLIENPVPRVHISTYTCLSGWLQRQTDVSRVWLPS